MQTIRQQIIAILQERELTVRDISQELSVAEKEIYQHLQHIAKSLAAQKKKMVVKPYACRDCGFTFSDRERFSRPGRCPKCRDSHLSPATFTIP